MATEPPPKRLRTEALDQANMLRHLAVKCGFERRPTPWSAEIKNKGLDAESARLCSFLMKFLVGVAHCNCEEKHLWVTRSTNIRSPSYGRFMFRCPTQRWEKTGERFVPIEGTGCGYCVSLDKHALSTNGRPYFKVFGLGWIQEQSYYKNPDTGANYEVMSLPRGFDVDAFIAKYEGTTMLGLVQRIVKGDLQLDENNELGQFIK